VRDRSVFQCALVIRLRDEHADAQQADQNRQDRDPLQLDLRSVREQHKRVIAPSSITATISAHSGNYGEMRLRDAGLRQEGIR
jgi:hypothetical protein